MAKRARKPKSGLEKAAAGIGRVLGKAMNRIKGIDAESEAAMEVRENTLQQIGQRRRAEDCLSRRVGPEAEAAEAQGSCVTPRRPGAAPAAAARKAPKRRVQEGQLTAPCLLLGRVGGPDDAKENQMDDKAKSPDPDDLTGDTPPTKPMSPEERRKLEDQVAEQQEEPDEDLPDPPAGSTA